MLVSLTILMTPFLIVLTAQAQTLTVLHNFTAGSDGSRPFGLTIDAAGNLYGTTEGYESCNPESSPGTCGSVFKLARKGSGWILSALYDFQSGNGGQIPAAPPVLGPDGALYASTLYGGTAGYGVVFRLAPYPNPCKTASCSWNETVLYSFPGGGNGIGPSGSLVFDRAGNIYGTTQNGGLQLCEGCGIVFELAHSNGGWTQSVLYSFTGGTDGAYPQNGVIFDSVGNLYGTAFEGGTYYYGSVFQLIPSGSGWKENTLYSFNAGNSGYYPSNGLLLDGSGNLYGGTYDNGSGGGGVAYQLAPSNGSWNYNVLVSFTGAVGPAGNFIMDTDGNVYGVTYNDGAYGQGNIFKLTPSSGSWTYSDLYDFTGGNDGKSPNSLVLGSAGNLYGTAAGGGPHDFGVVWELAP